ncbi:MAG: DUF6799 domain-containing protein [Bacteroidia bacterium]
MKTIILISLAVIITSCSYAQQTIDDSVSFDKGAKFGYYMMQPDYVIYCHENGKTDTLLADVSLRSGKMLTYRGELIEKNAKKIFLKEGECVNANGIIEDCAKLKKKLEKKTEKK